MKTQVSDQLFNLPNLPSYGQFSKKESMLDPYPRSDIISLTYLSLPQRLERFLILLFYQGQKIQMQKKKFYSDS